MFCFCELSPPPPLWSLNLKQMRFACKVGGGLGGEKRLFLKISFRKSIRLKLCVRHFKNAVLVLIFRKASSCVTFAVTYLITILLILNKLFYTPMLQSTTFQNTSQWSSCKTINSPDLNQSHAFSGLPLFQTYFFHPSPIIPKFIGYLSLFHTMYVR